MKWNFKEITGTGSDYILEHRILNAVALVGILISLICAPLNYLNNMPIITVYAPLIMTTGFSLLFIYSISFKKFKTYYYLLTFYVLLIVLPVSWITNAGSFSGTSNVFLFMLIALYITSKNSTNVNIALMLFGVFTVLLLVEYFYPEVIVNYDTRDSRYIDLFFSMTVVFWAIAGSLRIYKSIYRHALSIETKQKQQLENYNKEILRQGIEIEEQKKELMQANAAKDKLFRIIAHDLKSPFNTVCAISQLMKENIDAFTTDEIKECFKLQNEHYERTYNLVSNLLDWASSQTNGIKTTFEKINLRCFTEHLLEYMDVMAQEKQITLISTIADGIHVSADKNMLETILRNLLTNSIKFTPNNGFIEIKARKYSDKVCISIKDTGVGIASDHLEKLFTISEKASTNGTNNEKGSGLGLILCKEFVEKINGTIEVQSEVGKGSEFIVSLPVDVSTPIRSHSEKCQDSARLISIS